MYIRMYQTHCHPVPSLYIITRQGWEIKGNYLQVRISHKPDKFLKKRAVPMVTSSLILAAKFVLFVVNVT